MDTGDWVVAKWYWYTYTCHVLLKHKSFSMKFHKLWSKWIKEKRFVSLKYFIHGIWLILKLNFGWKCIMSCNQEMWSTLEVSCVYPILVPQDEMLHFTCIVQRESPKHVYYAILKILCMFHFTALLKYMTALLEYTLQFIRVYLMC